jgi:hypothetical protein
MNVTIPSRPHVPSERVVFFFSLTVSVLEGKDGSASASYCYITLRLPGRFWIVRN